jgi:hypothetical protein
MITGGVCLDDLVVLREEKNFKTIWRRGDIPYPTAMGDFLKRFERSSQFYKGKLS